MFPDGLPPAEERRKAMAEMEDIGDGAKYMAYAWCALFTAGLVWVAAEKIWEWLWQALQWLAGGGTADPTTTLRLFAVNLVVAFLLLMTRDWLRRNRKGVWFAVVEIGSAAGVGVHALQNATQRQEPLLLLAFVAAALVSAEGFNRARVAIHKRRLSRLNLPPS